MYIQMSPPSGKRAAPESAVYHLCPYICIPQPLTGYEPSSGALRARPHDPQRITE